MVNRNTLLSILSDARVAAPVLQTAKLHTKSSKSTFLYVFKHVTKYGHYPEVSRTESILDCKAQFITSKTY